jgi:uncharacterized protein
MYSIFQLSPAAPLNEQAYGSIRPERVSELVGLFSRTNATVLELAATIDWLWRKERCEDWTREITKRKAVKVRNGRLERAVELLRSIGLPPPTTASA